MFQSFRPGRAMTVAIVVATVAIVFSSLTIVRAQRFVVTPNAVTACASGRACVEGASKGKPWGVYGLSTGSNGVEGRSSAPGHAGIAGLHLADGFGVYAESHDSTGKYAALFARGDETGTNIFYGENRANKTTCLIDPSANLTCTGTLKGTPSANAIGVEGDSTANTGVHAVSDSGYGLEATSNGNDAIYASTAAPYSSAVVGVVSGQAGSISGILGYSGDIGVWGKVSESSGTGVAGQGGTGVFGEGNTGVEADSYALTQPAYGLFAVVNAGKGSYSVYAEGNGSGGGVCSIDFSANLLCSGKITGGQSFQTRHRTAAGRSVLAYASESTSATIEDFGTAQMTGGVADVQLEPAFASTIDPTRSYYVFLTPLGDTHGLYVSTKGVASFQVRELQHGRGHVGFDYRIVAHPLDAKKDRLPTAPAIYKAPVPRAPSAPKIPAPPPRR
jgi:hypothetical protein